jgi:hypothetical protein
MQPLQVEPSEQNKGVVRRLQYDHFFFFIQQSVYIKGLFGSSPLTFRALKKTLEHFSSVLRSNALMCGGLKFRANFKGLKS